MIFYTHFTGVLHICFKVKPFMKKFKDIFLRLSIRFEEFSDKVKRYDIFSKSGNKGIIFRLIIGAALFLLTCMPAMQNGWGMFLQILAFLLCTYDIILEDVGSILSKNIFVPKVMIVLASILAICVGAAGDALLFIIIYRVFEMLEKLLIKYSERDVKRILNLRTKDVKVYSEGKLVVTPTAKVKVGDYYMVAPGDRIPLDGIVVSGNSELDTETLTGDTQLRKVHKGSPVLSGSINVSGALSVRVTADLENSIVTKRLNYFEGYKEYEKNVSDSLKYFTTIFTPIACVVAMFIGIVPPIFMGGYAEWLHKAAVLLAVSCPVTVFTSSAITYFAGVGGAAANGVLFKNKEAVDSMSQIGCVLFDKNGTLSTGKYIVTSVEAENVTGKELMELASYAFAKSDSSIARAIMANVDEKPDTNKILNNYEDAGKCCVVQLDDGRVVAAGNEAMLKMMEMNVPVTHKGDTVVYVCQGREYMGCIRMSDKFRSDAHAVVEELHELEIPNVAMLSGDSKESGEIVANNLGVDNAYMAVNKQEKVTVFEQLFEEMPSNNALVYVSNNSDDTKLLEYPDVGVAMNGLISRKAIEHSNVIIVKSEPSKLCTAITAARNIRKMADTNAAIMTGVAAFVALFAIFDMVTLWSGAVLLGAASLITIINGSRAYNIKRK